jgi:catechol 2,3-dioxygenase-like lactoylglutathione lyase family enzyme
MVYQFLGIRIKVPDLDLAAEEFGIIADALQLPYDKHGWKLANTRLQLCEGVEPEPSIDGLRLSVDADIGRPADSRGLNLLFQPGGPVDISTAGVGVDHVVLQSSDAEDCIRLFRDQLGIRLALDQTVEEWGGRMLFFRAGKMTLEVIENARDRPAKDFFWGITFLCPELSKAHRALTAAGVALSELRAGRKPGTQVATLRSHTLGIPCLLVGPAQEAGR